MVCFGVIVWLLLFCCIGLVVGAFAISCFGLAC